MLKKNNMKYILFFYFLIAGALIGISQENEFVSLFNGQSLSGWTAANENPESFSVEDGILVCKGGRSHLYYTGSVGNADFKNFELRLSVRTTKGSNSGVYFHTKYQESGWPMLGFEAQVNSTQIDPRKTGSLYGIVNIWAPGMDILPFGARVSENGEVFVYQSHAQSTDDEWYDYHITVINNQIVLKVNGRITVDWTQPKDWAGSRKIGQGTIGLQAHDPDSETHYKDIRIKVLD